jgi:acetolactate synthase-1/2/3 large subunit
MPRINGGEMLVRALEREGVHEIFALHGGHLDAIFKACLEHGLRVIDTRHGWAWCHGRGHWGRKCLPRRDSNDSLGRPQSIAR